MKVIDRSTTSPTSPAGSFTTTPSIPLVYVILDVLREGRRIRTPLALRGTPRPPCSEPEPQRRPLAHQPPRSRTAKVSTPPSANATSNVPSRDAEVLVSFRQVSGSPSAPLRAPCRGAPVAHEGHLGYVHAVGNEEERAGLEPLSGRERASSSSGHGSKRKFPKSKM